MSIAWVTGARGFMGRRVAPCLRDQGLVVCGIRHGHLPSELGRQAVLSRWLNSQVSADALGRLAADHGLKDFVFYLAGGSAVGASPQNPLEDFTRSTATPFERLRNHSPRSKLVVSASAAVYGDTQVVPAEKSRRPVPVSPYSCHKVMVEHLCQEYSQVFGTALGHTSHVSLNIGVQRYADRFALARNQ